MNILLTNDDGYFAEGIKLLSNVLKKYGNVVIVAPKVGMSAKSTSITLGKALEVVKEDENVFSVTGTPADCASFGLSSLGIKFDLLVSGCNHGWNISCDIMYSGTIGACLQGLSYRIPCIAFSIEEGMENLEFLADKALEYIFGNNLLSKEYLLNVNLPKIKEYKGIEISSLYYRQEVAYFIKTEEGYLATRDLVDDYSSDQESDCYLVNNGYITITPLNKSLYHSEHFHRLKKI